VPIVLKSGSLNLLEPSGPVQACNGIALPFILQTFSVFQWGTDSDSLCVQVRWVHVCVHARACGQASAISMVTES